MVIAPMLAGAFFCDEASANPGITSEEQAALYCAANGKTAAKNISALLDSVGPVQSPSGRYELGYTLIVPILRYFKKVDGAWMLDAQALRANLATINDVDRPVIVHLSATHFVYAAEELSRELALDPRNLMWTRNGPATPQDYFNIPIVAWSLADQGSPMNVMRRQAFDAAVDALCALPAASLKKIVGVSVLGETHDVFPDLLGGPDYSIPNSLLTDYSPVMKYGFRVWLAQRYTTIQRLNQDLAANFASFDAVSPPSRDIRSEVLDGYFDHIDNFAAGSVPVYGWLHDKAGRDLVIKILLDGIEIGAAELGFNRTDVTEVLPDIADPNVGFRYNLDFRKLAYGLHTLDVQVSANRGPALQIAKRELVFIDRNLSPWVRVPSIEVTAAPMSSDPSLIGGLDGPAGGQQSIFYNPLADLWLQFRNLVVRNYIDQFARIASKSCIPTSKVFSHQIAPTLYGSWNSDVLAVEASQHLSPSYTPGTTLYGGAAIGGAFLSMKQRLSWTRYAVNEMHTIVPLSAEAYAQMFDLHRNNGAVFVAPYYMQVPNRLPSGGDLNRFLIAPSNPRYGSNLYFNALRALMSK